MIISTDVFLFFAVGLCIFGLVFFLLVLSVDARKDATKFHTIYHRAFTIAAGEYRAPLRIAAIGVVLWYFAAAAAALAVITAVA